MSLALALALLAPPFVVSSSERGVVLRWAWDEGPRPAGYFVERRDGGPWTRLTAQPLVRSRDRAAARTRLGERYDRYAGLLFPDDPRAEHADPESFRGLLLLAADAEPAVAQLLGVRYDDESARAGTTYEYRLVALTAEGERVVATSARVVAGRYTAPPGPDSVRAMQRAGGVGLRWTPLVRASGYHVYRGARRDGAESRRLNDAPVVILQGEGPIAIQAPTFFTDTTALGRDTVFYWVEWIDAFGRASRRSQPGALVPRDLTVPAPPSVVQTRLAGDTVVVSWVEPGGDVAGYQVWRGESAGGPFAKIGQPVRGATELRDPGRPVRRLSWYRVTSLDQTGREGDPSPVAFAEVRDLTPPAAPSGLVGTSDTGRLVVRWAGVAAGDVRGYRVYRAATADGGFALLSDTPQRDTTFRDPVPRQSDHPYFYRVTAVDSAFNESAPSAVLALRPPDVIPPSAPRLVAVRGMTGGLRLEWLANPEPDVVAYRIRYRVAGTGAWSEAPAPVPAGGAAAQRDSLGGLDANRRYEVSLVAVDDAGNRSVPARAVVGTTLRPANGTAPELRRVTFDRAARAVIVEWSQAIGEVLILRKQGAQAAFHPVGSAPAGVTRFVDRLVRAGRTYEYRISVRDALGNPLESRARQVAVP